LRELLGFLDKRILSLGGSISGLVPSGGYDTDQISENDAFERAALLVASFERALARIAVFSADKITNFLPAFYWLGSGICLHVQRGVVVLPAFTVETG
jgi:hypothetical protein